ncbi:hypothetical protein D3C81_1380070 [compost metagenome]
MVVTEDLLSGLLLCRQAVARHSHQAAVLVTHIQCAHHAAQVSGEKTQDVVAEHGQRELTQYLLGQLGLAVA